MDGFIQKENSKLVSNTLIDDLVNPPMHFLILCIFENPHFSINSQKPEMLKLGTDVATITDIAKFTQESRQNLLVLNQTIEKLEIAVSKEVGEDANYPLDSLFGEQLLRKRRKKKISVIFGVSFLTVAIAASVCYFKNDV